MLGLFYFYGCQPQLRHSLVKYTLGFILLYLLALTALQISWAYAPGEVRVVTSSDGLHYDQVAPALLLWVDCVGLIRSIP